MNFNLIHSFYNKNCNIFKRFTYSCYFMLSAIYAKRINKPITLYTDYDFKEILNNDLYKDINLVFEHDYNINSLFWAWPKFVALEYAGRNAIHIDGDVFLKTYDSINHINSLIESDCDALTQHLEKLQYSDDIELQKSVYAKSFDAIKTISYPEFIKKEIPTQMPNNGILYIKNDTLWKQYYNLYFDSVYKCNDCIYLGPGCCPDIIFEQSFLEHLCNHYGYKMKYFLDVKSSDDLITDAAKKHYQHVCVNKVNRLPLCIKYIKKFDIDTYNMIKFLWYKEFSQFFELAESE